MNYAECLAHAGQVPRESRRVGCSTQKLELVKTKKEQSPYELVVSTLCIVLKAVRNRHFQLSHPAFARNPFPAENSTRLDFGMTARQVVNSGKGRNRVRPSPSSPTPSP